METGFRINDDQRQGGRGGRGGRGEGRGDFRGRGDRDNFRGGRGEPSQPALQSSPGPAAVRAAGWMLAGEDTPQPALARGSSMHSRAAWGFMQPAWPSFGPFAAWLRAGIPHSHRSGTSPQGRAQRPQPPCMQGHPELAVMEPGARAPPCTPCMPPQHPPAGCADKGVPGQTPTVRTSALAGEEAGGVVGPAAGGPTVQHPRSMTRLLSLAWPEPQPDPWAAVCAAW